MITERFLNYIMQAILMMKKRHRMLFIVLVILFLGASLAWYAQFSQLDKISEWVNSMPTQWHSFILFIGGLAYIILLSLPFIPGVELGLVLMCLFGKEGIIFVYLCTVIGLNLSFAIGHLLPRQWVFAWLAQFGVASSDIEAEGDHWMRHLLSRSTLGDRLKDRLGAHLVKYRYAVLGVLFNLPGNFILGGGGGIALICGINRSFSWLGFLITVVIATTPVPLLAYLGVIQIENLITDIG